MENKTREAIRFEGSVQGVGFRYRMSQLARHYDVTGWVRNEYDGSVSAELQGRREAIDDLSGQSEPAETRIKRRGAGIFRALLGATARWCCETQLQNGVEEGNILYRKTAVRMRTHRP